MSSNKLWQAYCSDCECVTEMEKTLNPKEGLCTECHKIQVVGQNPRKLAELRSLQRTLESQWGAWLQTRDRIEAITRTLDPIEVTPKPKWERLTVEMSCRECDRRTRHAFNGLPHCYPKCKPRPGKISADDVPEVIAMIREYLGGHNDDDDFEVMKFKTPEAS